MKPADLFRNVRELEARIRRLRQIFERANEEMVLLEDGMDRVRTCLEQIKFGKRFPPPQLDPTARPAKHDERRRPRHVGNAWHIADPSPRVIDRMEIEEKFDGSAVLVLHGERPADTRRFRLPAAPAELLRALAADDGRPRIGDCVSAKPNSELMRKLHTRDGGSLSYNALKQRVHVLRRFLVERCHLDGDVLSEFRVGGEPGYRLALRHR